MLRLIKKHLAACSKTSEKDWKCDKNSRCPFYVVGPDPAHPTGPRIKEHAGTSDERLARAVLFEKERSLYDPRPEPPKLTPIVEAIELFLATKKHRSVPRQKKLKLQLERMATFLADSLHRDALSEVSNIDLQKWMQTLEGEYSTLKTERENLKSFWRWCFNSDLMPKNIAASLPTIGDPRREKIRRVPTLTLDEVKTIILTAGRCDSLYARSGPEVRRQVRAFTLVQKFTGLAIGDVAKLRVDEVSVKSNEIFVNRKKTGEEVWTVVPPIVIEALQSFKPDSNEYFFWSGHGELHTRTSKWGERLQKLYASAGVRVTEQIRVRRSGGRLKNKPEKIMVSAVTPHMWRHTFVRDLYLKDKPVEMIADLIGDDVDTVREYYSSFDELRRKKLKAEMEALWAEDPLTRELGAQSGHS